jgi:uncharacterized membrane protein YkvA (DUF1232 family)
VGKPSTSQAGTTATRKASVRRAGDREVLARFGDILTRLPNYTRLAWGLLRHEGLTRRQKGTLLAGLAYLASPIDLVPGVIPILGQLDDLTAVLLSLRLVVGSLSEDRARQNLAEAGLTAADLDQDLATIGLVAALVVRRGAAAVGRVLGFAAGTLYRGVAGSLTLLQRGGSGLRRIAR